MNSTKPKRRREKCRNLQKSIAFTFCAIIIIAAVGLASFQASGPISTESSVGQARAKAVNYLLANYNQVVGLVSETPGSSTFWLYSDNFLSALALSLDTRGNATVSAIAMNITETLNGYQTTPNRNENQYVVSTNGQCIFHNSVDFLVSSTNGNQIKMTINNGTSYLSESSYADIAFLTAICLKAHGSISEALEAYEEGASMYNGIGFVDSPFLNFNSPSFHQFQTYKLALFVYASADLGMPINQDALAALLTKQAGNGGFYSGYYSNGSTGTTQTNTETTSLALLAIESCNSQAFLHSSCQT